MTEVRKPLKDCTIYTQRPSEHNDDIDFYKLLKIIVYCLLLVSCLKYIFQ